MLRDPAAVAADVINGVITPEHAVDAYGYRPGPDGSA
jgi:hypothetical protein